MKHSLRLLISLLLVAVGGFRAHAGTVSTVPHDAVVYADIVDKELVWANEKSASPDLQATYSKKTGQWHLLADKNKVDVKKLGTPWQTDGSTVGILSAKSSVANGYVVSCINDIVSSSGIAGIFSTSYLIFKSAKQWRAFVFSAQNGCDDVELNNPQNVQFSYQKIDLKNPGRITVNRVVVTHKNERLALVEKKVRFENNTLIRRHFNVVKNSLIQ
jgi:hypothetical protein